MTLNLPELTVANDALGDAAALDRLWRENGYLFFRDVLDRDAIAEARGRVLAILRELGVVDGADNRWNGADVSDFPDKVEALYQAGIWQELAASPHIRRFFESVMSAPIAWVPLSGYRTTAPGAGDSEDPFENRHQDGFMNGDIPFRTCWIPLDVIDRETGGLALAQGEHRRGYLHDRTVPPRYPIPPDAVPLPVWRSAAYRPGDVIMFERHIPHAGLPNRSGRFRLSLDVRLMRADDPARPIVGRMVSISPDEAVIDGEAGRRTVRLDADTYLRANSGTRLDFATALPFFAEGTEVMVGHRDGVATMMKPIQ